MDTMDVTSSGEDEFLDTSDHVPGSWRRYLSDILDRPESSVCAQTIHYILIAIIFGSVVLTVLETMPEMRNYMVTLLALDYIVTVLFTIEISLRFYIADNCMAFLSFFNIIDIISIVPGYMELFILLHADYTKHMHAAAGSMRTLRCIRVIRLMRVIRVVKLTNEWHHVRQMALLFKVMCQVTQSGLYVILLLMGLLTIISAAMIYLFEAPQCIEGDGRLPLDEPIPPEACMERSRFDSIPSAFWWAVVTLTSVGYGDMVPATVMGKLIAGLMCVCAVMILAITAAQFSVHFREKWIQAKAREHVRRLTDGNSWMAQDHAECEKLVAEFQTSLDELLVKVTSISSEVGGGAAPWLVAPLLTSIKEHSDALTAETWSFVYDTLSEAMLKDTTGARRDTADESQLVSAAEVEDTARHIRTRRISQPQRHPRGRESEPPRPRCRTA